MTDFRAIERDLIEFFEAAGVDIIKHEGDAFAVVTSIDCPIPRQCEATLCDGHVVCPCLLNEGPSNVAHAEAISLSLTRLAERLAAK